MPAGTACPRCSTPLPEAARFCPGCGATTPTGFNPVTGSGESVVTRESDLAARRTELQRALGAGWELRGLIGQGGFGEVWAALDTRLKRDVAVKTLRSDLVASAALLARFQREAEAVARLRHPHIIPIYQVGEAEGLAFFVMPLVHGASLQAVLERETKLGIEEARRIFAEAASALDAAHKAGIVHRDVKPENIMLDGEERRVLLMDFGIARAVGSDEGRLTGTGLVVGTPQYMSPEQASADKNIDHRSDIYSLGAVAYQMLAGRQLFDTRLARELVIHHITTEPDDLRKVRPEVPDDLADAVMRCLQKEPDKRWASAGELAKSIRPVVQATASGRSWGRWLRPRAGRRGRTRWYVAALVLTIAGAVIIEPSSGRFLWDLARAIVTGDIRRARPFQPQSEFRKMFSFEGGNTRYRGREPQLASLNDTALFVSAPIGGPMVFNGATWRGLDIPTGNWVFPPVVLNDTIWIAAAGPYPGMSLLHAVSANGTSVRDTVQHAVVSVWGDGRSILLGAADGALLRGRPGQWRREPTGETRRVSNLWGDSSRQFGLMSGGVLQFNGMNWRRSMVGDKETRTLTAGSTLRDGNTVVVGNTCDNFSCRAAVFARDARSGNWRSAASGLPSPLELYGVGGASLDDFFVYGATGEPACGDGKCIHRVVHGSARPVDAIRGDFHVIGVAMMRGAPYVLTSAGGIWTERDGQWGVVSEVPGSVYRGLAISPSIKIVWGQGLMVETRRRGLAPRQRSTVRDVVIATDASSGSESVWMLDQNGALSRIVCRPAQNECDPEAAVAAPDGRRARDLELAADGQLWIAGERGLLARRAGDRWTLVAASGAGNLEREDIVSISLRANRPALVLSATELYERRPDGTMRRWRELGPSLGLGVRVVGVPRGGAMVLADAGVFYVNQGGATNQIAGRGLLSSMEVLDDGRIVLGFARPDDPLVGGSLMVGRSEEAGRNPNLEEVPVGQTMDVYGMAEFGSRLEVVGSGGFWIQTSVDKLPFPPAAQLVTGSHGAAAFLLLPNGDKVPLSSVLRAYSVPSGRARFAIWSASCVLWDSVFAPRGGETIRIGFRDPPCKP